MAQAQYGDEVTVHYTGKLEDGTVFDTSIDQSPLRFIMGDGQIIPGLEKAILGMNPGESKTIKVPMDEAYGPRREEMLLVVDRNEFPVHMKPEAGELVEMRHPDGQRITVPVIHISESSVTLDANHPLAGKDLTFDIQLLEIA